MLVDKTIYTGQTGENGAYVTMPHALCIGSFYLTFTESCGTFTVKNDDTGETRTCGGYGFINEFVDVQKNDFFENLTTHAQDRAAEEARLSEEARLKAEEDARLKSEAEARLLREKEQRTRQILVICAAAAFAACSRLILFLHVRNKSKNF